METFYQNDRGSHKIRTVSINERGGKCQSWAITHFENVPWLFLTYKKCDFEIRTFFTHFCTFAFFKRAIAHFVSHLKSAKQRAITHSHIFKEQQNVRSHFFKEQQKSAIAQSLF